MSPYPKAWKAEMEKRAAAKDAADAKKKEKAGKKGAEAKELTPEEKAAKEAEKKKKAEITKEFSRLRKEEGIEAAKAWMAQQ